MVMVFALVGESTLALFSDAESSQSNSFAAGTFQIGADPRVVNLSNLMPGDSDQFTISLSNQGSLVISTIDMETVTTFTDGEAADNSDYDHDGMVGNAADIADVIAVTAAFDGNAVVFPDNTDANNDGYISFTEMEAVTVPLPGGLAVGEVSDLVFNYSLAENAGAEYYRDSLSIDLTFIATP